MYSFHALLGVSNRPSFLFSSNSAGLGFLRRLDAPNPPNAAKFRNIMGNHGLGNSATIGAKIVKPRQKKLQIPKLEITKCAGKRSMWITYANPKAKLAPLFARSKIKA